MRIIRYDFDDENEAGLIRLPDGASRRELQLLAAAVIARDESGQGEPYKVDLSGLSREQERAWWDLLTGARTIITACRSARPQPPSPERWFLEALRVVKRSPEALAVAQLVLDREVVR